MTSVDADGLPGSNRLCGRRGPDLAVRCTRPTPPGSIEVRARPASPIMPVGTGCRRGALRSHPQPDQKEHEADRLAHDREMNRSPICSSGGGESISIIDPNSRLMMPPSASSAEARHLDFENEQDDAEENQSECRVADRQHLKREECEQQADAAGDAGKNRPWTPELDRQTRACRASTAGRRSAGGRRALNARCAQVIVDALDARTLDAYRLHAPVEAGHASAVELASANR